MGWLHMHSLRGHAGPRQYLDAQFTFSGPQGSSRVLRSALVGLRVYYAAVERLRPRQEREVSALVCLVRYNPRDREGFIFGYKDMHEAMGPCESDCPEAILNLLTSTDQPYALAWRAQCRANIKQRRTLAAKPKPAPGQTIVFDVPVTFTDGVTLDRLDVVADPRGRRTVLFRDPARGGLYRIANVKARSYRLIDPPRP